MQDDDAYEMIVGNFAALRGRYSEREIQKWAKRIGSREGIGTQQNEKLNKEVSSELNVPPVAVQGAEHRTSLELFGALAATFHAPPVGSRVMEVASGAPAAGSAFVRNGSLIKPDDASSSESQSTSPPDSSQS